jgi:hypothetical protein
MEPSELAIEILRDIRDQTEKTNARLDETNRRLDEASRRLDQRLHEPGGRVDAMRDELSRRIVETEIKTTTALAELAGTVREMTGVLRAQHDLRPRVEKCERDILEVRLRLEER